MSTITEVINDYKPNNKKITNDTYITRIKKLTQSNVNLQDSEEVKDFLKNKTFRTRRSYYVSIVVYLKALQKNTDIYDSIVKTMGKEIEDQDKKNESDTPIVKKKEIEDILERLMSFHVKAERDLKFTSLQDYLILALYFYIPPIRNDYVLVDVYDSVALFQDQSKNWISLTEKKLYLNKYKTEKKYGQIVIDLPDILITTIKNLFQTREVIYPHTKGNPALLLNHKLERMTKTNLIHRLNKIFGRNISVTQLRKSYISEKYPVFHTVKEMEKDAKAMGHSVALQQSTYRKKM